MSMVSLRQLLDHAAENNYGVGAFNVNNMEQIQAIMEAARETESPVIIQASRGARKYTNDRFLYHLMMAAVELYPEIPVVLHQDHGNSPETCFSAMEQGFTSVMMDGSLMADGKTASTFEYNVEVTKKVVDFAHPKGVSVEGELGVLGHLSGHAGEKEDGHGFEGKLSREDMLTDPDEAAEFVRLTGVDALAVAIEPATARTSSPSAPPEMFWRWSRLKNPQALAQHSPCDARQLFCSPGTAGLD